MTDVEKIRAACKSRGIAVSKLEADLKFGNGFLNPKKVQTVQLERAREIAAYLEMSFCDLFGDEKTAPTLNESERWLIDAYRQLDESGKTACISMIRGLLRDYSQKNMGLIVNEVTAG